MDKMRASDFTAMGLSPAYRTAGMAPGDYIDVLRIEIANALKAAGGSRRKAVSAGLKRMLGEGLITASDLKRLEIASAAIFQAEQAKRAPADTVAKLDRLYLEALADPGSSSMGTTMIGLTYSARTNQAGSGMGLFGMLIGGMITGGPGGALIGGLIGWVAGTACSDEND